MNEETNGTSSGGSSDFDVIVWRLKQKHPKDFDLNTLGGKCSPYNVFKTKIIESFYYL